MSVNHSLPGPGGPSSLTVPSTRHASGALPRKCRVSTTTVRSTPGTPSRTRHQSSPGTRLRRDSQPSISLPRSV